MANLEEIRAKLELDLQDKTEALKIDMDQLELTHHSSSLSHKPDPLRVPNKLVVTSVETHQCSNSKWSPLTYFFSHSVCFCTVEYIKSY